MSAEEEASPCKSRTTLLRLGLLGAVGIAVIASATGFILGETERAIVLRFGKPVRILQDPGFHLRLPLPLEKVVRIDRRLQHADIRLSETLTRDQRNVIIPMFYTWRVEDALLFHTSVHDPEIARVKLDALVTSARNSVLGRHAFNDLVAGKAEASPLPEIEKEILALAAPDARQQLGIELIATGITQIQLPEANTESVFRRMRAERMREATQYRAEGRAKAGEMKAETDKNVARLIADAKRQAEETRGKAEADAAGIYAQAHGESPEFYRFLRELQSLRTVVDKNTTVILDTSVAPFHWLKSIESELPGAPSPSHEEITPPRQEAPVTHPPTQPVKTEAVPTPAAVPVPPPSLEPAPTPAPADPLPIMESTSDAR